MNTVKTVILSLVFVATALTLGACSESEQASQTREARELQAEQDVLLNNTTEITKKMSDGRTVTCLAYNGYREVGISCDWANAR